MPTLHPSSAGLRQLADFLDNCAEEGIDCAVQARITLTKENLIPLHKRLNLTPKFPEMVKDWESVRTDTDYHGLPLELWNWAQELCESTIEMRPTKVWKCGGVEVTK